MIINFDRICSKLPTEFRRLALNWKSFQQ